MRWRKYGLLIFCMRFVLALIQIGFAKWVMKLNLHWKRAGLKA